jgi:autotransporter translocation and assembly factor TamB
MRTFVLLASLCVLACLLVSTAFAADVTGKWTAQVPGRQGNMQEMTINLKADGSTLTGSITTPRGDMDIKDGKIDGNNISFSQTFERGGNSMTILYKGKVSSDGDSIEFTREMQGGQGQARTFTAKRVK